MNNVALADARRIRINPVFIRSLVIATACALPVTGAMSHEHDHVQASQEHAHEHDHGHDHHGTEHAWTWEQAQETPLAEGVVAGDCWVRLLPSPVPSAAYFRLDNHSDGVVSLQAAASPAFASVMLHKTEEVDGISRMDMAGDIEVPAGGQLSFEPGSYHIMLEQSAHEIQVGDEMPMALLLDGHLRTDLSCAVRPAAANGRG